MNRPSVLNKKLFGERHGVTPPAVTRWIRKGLPVRADGQIDVAAGDAWHREHVDRSYDPRGQIAAPAPDLLTVAQPMPTSGLQAARTQAATAQAKLLEARLAALAEQTVERTEVERAVFQRWRFERDSWQSWPSRIAAAFALQLGADVEPTRQALVAAVREQLDYLASTPFSLEAA